MKKLISALLSATLLAGVAAMPAAAEGIKDFNGDGRCDISDVIFLNRYLSGAMDYTDTITDLDINGNYIIDTVDAQAYLVYLSGGTY